MLEALFSHFCHQMPERSFALGPAVLPFCQRCTGVYLGAVAAALLWASFGRRQRRALPWPLAALNVLFILAMGFFGFDFIETPPGIRYATGAVFGSAVVMLAWPLVLAHLTARERPRWSASDVARYLLVLAALVVGPPMLFHFVAAGCAGARTLADVLAILGLLGLALVLVLPNLLAAQFVVGSACRTGRSRPARRRLPLVLAIFACLLAAELIVILRL
jgi:uncharacterized membrane protein